MYVDVINTYLKSDRGHFKRLIKFIKYTYNKPKHTSISIKDTYYYRNEDSEVTNVKNKRNDDNPTNRRGDHDLFSGK